VGVGQRGAAMEDRPFETPTDYRIKDSWPRRLARPLVVLLVPIGITPNQVTVTRLVLGLGACGLLTTGERGAAAVAGALWLLAVFLDRVDGELARMAGKSSAFGQRLDYATDLVLASTFFVALGLGLGGLAVWAGIAAGAAILVIQVVAEIIDRAQADTGAKAFPGFAGFDPEDSHACFAPVVWLGWEAVFLDAAAIGAPLFAVLSLVRLAALRRGGLAAGPDGERGGERPDVGG
jgi:archaetidylinositol phosphate synthase